MPPNNGSITSYITPYNKSDFTGDILLDASIAVSRGVAVGLLTFFVGKILGKNIGVDKYRAVNWSDYSAVQNFFLSNFAIGDIAGGFSTIVDGVYDLIAGIFQGEPSQALKDFQDIFQGGSEEGLLDLFDTTGDLLASLFNGDAFNDATFVNDLTNFIASTALIFVPG
ncbi:MAG: hypothetical protein F6K30_29630, partial [Cyanothece sp. SIO2G6]|nr:hypothetical protein [Cyanothece sp. SIO2G6]